MIVGPARALFMDEISTGLDSSTTFQIVKSVQQMNHIFGDTTVISMLQPAPDAPRILRVNGLQMPREKMSC